MEISVYSPKGEEKEKIKLPAKVFSAKVNPSLMAQAIRVYLANRRVGTASTKTRGEVEGSTRKIYRQKGTGRARHGGVRAPIFVKGGIVFGPKPRDYSLSFPKKMRRLALYSALTSKLKEKRILVVSGLGKIKKTKEMVRTLRKLKLKPEKEKITLVLNDLQENIILASRNLQKLMITSVKLLNTYDVLNSQKILFTKEGVEALDKNAKR